ncbi:MmcQ/YjbR family DNA-binding protein [Jannaschia sp. M317]|uniref:MmcQ/YjbR family DNA-binding protein n=1 Tax=Jannaschia sp. M317 TaxID=2867011 RepID=UPI0021A6A133|nr:MmcQ/YjbR family DNA-binding protein [Jannaschia sp. M317]UWQ18792.1 MmcQ/YjbR family DNA-binding protein [Jannaschia sp. M317]
MTRADADTICGALPGAVLAHPPELVSWKVGDKMFACFGGDGDMTGVSVKTDSVETSQMLIDAGPAVRAPYFHKSWVRLPFDTTDVEEATHRIRVSYDLIRSKLPAATRNALPEA